MPLPGDQHRENHITANPFLVPQPHISQYTAQEIATLQSRLDKQLGPEYISTRPGNGGGKVHYLAAEKVINLANEVFGFNGWSSAIQNVQIDFVDENEHGRVNLGLSSIVRVTLRDGTFHEDVGYGHCENTKGKAAAFEKAKKESVTDAMKRALRNFGNVLGNCLYDKDYLQKVTKVKVAPSRWDANKLHRHPDYAPIKSEPASTEVPQPNKESAISRNASAQTNAENEVPEIEEDFGGDVFDDTDFVNPDEVRVDEQPPNALRSPAQHAMRGQQAGRHPPPPRTTSMPQMRPPNAVNAPAMQNVRPPMGAGQTTARSVQPQTPSHQQRNSNAAHGTLARNPDGSKSNPPPARDPSANSSKPTTDADDDATTAHGPPPPQDIPPGVPNGFTTGRSADVFNNPPGARPPNAVLAFNPHAESPSIRRTHGLNPGKSMPIRREHIENAGNSHVQQHHQMPPPAGGGPQGGAAHGFQAAPRPQGANIVNPSSDANRRIGMPQHAGGRPQNGAPYRPPTTTKRPAMTDVTNIKQMDGASDAKKAKIEPAPQRENAAKNDAVAT